MRTIHAQLENILKENDLSENKSPDLKSWNLVLDQVSSYLGEKDSHSPSNDIAASSQLHKLRKFVGATAHEINTPLAIIQIRVDQLLEEIQAGNFNPEFFEKSVRSIESTLQRLGEIVSRLKAQSSDSNSEKS